MIKMSQKSLIIGQRTFLFVFVFSSAFSQIFHYIKYTVQKYPALNIHFAVHQFILGKVKSRLLTRVQPHAKVKKRCTITEHVKQYYERQSYLKGKKIQVLCCLPSSFENVWNVRNVLSQFDFFLLAFLHWLCYPSMEDETDHYIYEVKDYG